jgi:hypothetical protein
MTNLRRGFNRLFVVLTVAWAVYCLLVFPQQQKRKAMAEYSTRYSDCYSEYLGKNERAACTKVAAEFFKVEVDSWSPRNFYIGAWWILLLAVVALPLIVYWLCRGTAAVSLWVWRGFKANPAEH